MKKLVGIVVVLFIVFMSYVFIGGFIQKSLGESHTATKATSSVKNKDQAQPYTTANVTSHDSVSDCWLIINNNVYDVTTFLGQHPGGASTIIPYCGKEATKAFDTQDRGPRGGHSPSAVSLLADYLIGVIK